MHWQKYIHPFVKAFEVLVSDFNQQLNDFKAYAISGQLAKDAKQLAIGFKLVYILLIPCLIVQSVGDDLILLLRYQQEAVNNGQFWRIITANFCHSNWFHWLLNMTGLILIDFFFQPLISLRVRAQLIAFCITLNVILLHLTMDLNWYVGMSGALHGYLIGGALLSFPKTKYFQFIITCEGALLRVDTLKIINTLIILVVSLKLFAELVWNLNLATEELIESNVLEESHLYGAISALIYFILSQLYQHVTGS